MNDIFEDLGDDPFEPITTPAPAKRGRPAGQSKPKPKASSKPRWNITKFQVEAIMEPLMDLAWEIDPQARQSNSARLRVAAELLEIIENKKA